MLAEWWAGRLQGRSVYAWRTLISDLSCGVASLLGKGVVGLSAVVAYEWVRSRLGVLDLPKDNVFVWVSGFLLMDLVLYWRHRVCHRTGLFWALHAVHHQSPDLNVGTAIRVPWLQDLQIMPFVFVSAMIGYPTELFALHTALATISALVTHTRVVPKLGPLEAVLITPSHHRVHHAFNGPYLDRNFGAVFVFWDKLLGTFEPESIEPIYGTPSSADELDALHSNLRPFQELFARAATAPTWFGVVETLFRPPSWDPITRREELPQALPSPPAGPERLPWERFLALLLCTVVALVPLAFAQIPFAAKAMVGVVVFAGLSWTSRFRASVAAAPAVRLGGAG